MQAQLWARKQAAAVRPPSDTASAAANGNGGSGGPAWDQRERVDATPVADLLSDVCHPGCQLHVHCLTTAHRSLDDTSHMCAALVYHIHCIVQKGPDSRGTARQ
jgi:hypothetical protein